MRCSASQTTSTAADARAQTTAREVLDALLFREILKPLARGLGPVAEIALGSVADGLFVRKPQR